MNKQAMLDLIRQERKRFDNVFRQINEMHLAEAPIVDGWTVKDVVAHVTTWERRTITWLATAARGEPQRILDTEAIDRLNNQTLIENKNRPLELGAVGSRLGH
ncbi:MAG: ClbS/DfsB family four-helix bundle protein [Chloroflexi bacterium]|nr:ClbS/DfsB family four-helix bundle protein [Chloroflexota bacterium]